MSERIFRIQYCDEGCDHPELEWCFRVSRHCVSRCVRCVVKEIIEDWICDDCGSKFDKFVEYFEVYEAPKIEPGQKTVPAIVVIKRVCSDCHRKRLNQTKGA